MPILKTLNFGPLAQLEATRASIAQKEAARNDPLKKLGQVASIVGTGMNAYSAYNTMSQANQAIADKAALAETVKQSITAKDGLDSFDKNPDIMEAERLRKQGHALQDAGKGREAQRLIDESQKLYNGVRTQVNDPNSPLGQKFESLRQQLVASGVGENIASQITDIGKLRNFVHGQFSQLVAQSVKTGQPIKDILAGFGLDEKLTQQAEVAASDLAKTLTVNKATVSGGGVGPDVSAQVAGRKYGYDKSFESSKYGADKRLEGAKYGADSSAKASIYSADKRSWTSLEASKLSAKSAKTVANIKATAKSKNWGTAFVQQYKAKVEIFKTQVKGLLDEKKALNTALNNTSVYHSEAEKGKMRVDLAKVEKDLQSTYTDWNNLISNPDGGGAKVSNKPKLLKPDILKKVRAKYPNLNVNDLQLSTLAINGLLE